MPSHRSPKTSCASVLVLLGWLALCEFAVAQGPLPSAPAPSSEAVAPVTLTPVPFHAENQHKFWDVQNRALFAAVAASSTADFFVTRANLQNGGQELNPVVRVFGHSTLGLTLNFTGETAGVIGLSYFFHRSNHHRLERLVSMVNIGASTGAVSYGLSHR